MQTYTYIFLLAAVFQVSWSQEAGGLPPGPPPPPQCRRPPPLPGNVRPHDCCRFPHVFPMEDLKECGFEEPGEGRPPRGHHMKDCSVQKCVMKKNNLAQEDGESLDTEATLKYLKKWAEENPDFKNAMEIAMDKCLGKELPGPPGVCPIAKTVFCITVTLINNCPKWEESEPCTAVKNHIEECKKYFP